MPTSKSRKNRRLLTPPPAPPGFDIRLALSPEETALRCGISLSRLYKDLRSGDLRSFKLGRRTLILSADIEAWIRALPPTRTGIRKRSVVAMAEAAAKRRDKELAKSKPRAGSQRAKTERRRRTQADLLPVE